jgi:Uncharacterised nucleotidyltransferase
MSARGLVAPESALALVMAATHARREANGSVIADLASQADFGALEALLRSQGILSLVGQRLLDLTDCVPDAFAVRVQEHRHHAQLQGVGQQMITIRLSAALADAGVKALPLKGPPLGERLHGSLDARVSADIDLLVAADDLVTATDALSKLGYRRAPRAGPIHKSRPDLHECLRSTVGLPEVELHWRVHHYEQSFSEAMLRRAVPGADGCPRPTTSDDLIALLLFYARDGMVGLRLLADITAWWDRFGDALTPAEVDELAREHPAIIPAVATAALAAEHLGGLPAEDLFASGILSRASQSAIRLSNWCARGRESEVAANLFMVDCLLCPPDRRRALVTRHLWPDETVFGDEWSDTGLSRGALIRARILHLMRVSGRCLIALWQLQREGEWAPVPVGMSSGEKGDW